MPDAYRMIRAHQEAIRALRAKPRSGTNTTMRDSHLTVEERRAVARHDVQVRALTPIADADAGLVDQAA